MNKIVEKFINDTILEASLDARIPDGILNIKNHEHIQILAERMYDRCGDESIVNEFVSTFVEEGKYPDRQAFNKDGWLVTFPSKDYRDAAIKKGTHSISDPTHGKGGMNLYYKRKGKQKRQTQQIATKTEPDSGNSVDPSKPQVQPKAQVPKKQTGGVDTSKLPPDVKSAYEKAVGKKQEPTEPKIEPKIEPKPEKPSTVSSPEKETQPTQSTPSSQAPAIDVPVVTTPPAEYASISQKFAKQKGWTVTEYGEYHDREGNPVAVVGLSGEIVPIRSNDREEYKIFAEKQMPS